MVCVTRTEALPASSANRCPSSCRLSAVRA